MGRDVDVPCVDVRTKQVCRSHTCFIVLIFIELKFISRFDQFAWHVFIFSLFNGIVQNVIVSVYVRSYACSLPYRSHSINSFFLLFPLPSLFVYLCVYIFRGKFFGQFNIRPNKHKLVLKEYSRYCFMGKII